MADAPGSLVCDASLALNFLRRYAVTSAGHQIHGEKPDRELRARLMKDRVGAWVNVVSAFLAGEGAALAHHVELRANATGRAENLSPTEVDLHEFGQASRVVGISGLERLEGIFRHVQCPN